MDAGGIGERLGGWIRQTLSHGTVTAHLAGGAPGPARRPLHRPLKQKIR
jgi:hypothetical protein